MREINIGELSLVSGGFHINIGTAIAALAIGLVTGGPVGLGIVASGLVVNQGVNNLDDMRRNGDIGTKWWPGR